MCAVPSKVIFCSSLMLIWPGILPRHVSSPCLIAPSAPMITGIVSVLIPYIIIIIIIIIIIVIIIIIIVIIIIIIIVIVIVILVIIIIVIIIIFIIVIVFFFFRRVQDVAVRAEARSSFQRSRLD